jgi:hypothetical protein
MYLSPVRDANNSESAFIDDVVSGSLEAQRDLKGRAMALARKHLNADEYLELERDFAAGNVEVRLFPDGAVLTRGV